MYLIKIRETQITVSQMRVTACDTVDFAERVVPVVLLFLTGCPALVFICCLHGDICSVEQALPMCFA